MRRRGLRRAARRDRGRDEHGRGRCASGRRVCGSRAIAAESGPGRVRSASAAEPRVRIDAKSTSAVRSPGSSSAAAARRCRASSGPLARSTRGCRAAPGSPSSAIPSRTIAAARSQSPASAYGKRGKKYSQPTARARPRPPPTASTVVPGSSAHRACARCGSSQVDERAGRRVDLLAVDREHRVARDDDVHLLVAERLLGVLLDHLVAGLRRRVRVHPERGDAERAADRASRRACRRPGCPRSRPGAASSRASASRSAASTTGSIRVGSSPIRSSRFSHAGPVAERPS